MVSPLGTLDAFSPITPVVPFTYRDTATNMTILRELEKKLNELIVNINDVALSNTDNLNLAIEGLTADLNELLVESLNTINASQATLTAMEVTLGTLQTTLVSDQASIADALTDITALHDSVVTDLATMTTDIAAKIDKGSMVLNVKDYGANPDNANADDYPAFLAAYNAANPGDTIYVPPTGGGKWYTLATGLVVTKPNIRIATGGRDYATIIKGVTPGMTMITVKAPSFVLDQINLTGDGGNNGIGATINGLDLFGDVDGNVDTTIRQSTIIGMVVGARVRARNAYLTDNTFTSCLKGVVFEGKDAVYHTGPNASSNRGNLVDNCRFHNIGNATTDAAIEFTTTSKILHATVQGCFFDSNGLGRHIVATGTVTDPLKQLKFVGNKHTESSADTYTLTYCNFAAISDASINGNSAAGFGYGNAFVISNCDTVTIDDALIVQAGKSGVVARNNVRLLCRNVTVSSSGIDPGNVGHGFDVDATNTGCAFEGCRVLSCDGWGFTGSPIGSVMRGCEFISNTLGTIDSLTITNRASKGLNTYTEGKFGRYEDVAAQAFDLLAGVAKPIATVTAGSTFGSFLMSVSYSARDGVGDCYIDNRYIVRVENGVPVVTAVGTAAAARIVLTTAASGATAITVSLTSTAASSGVAVVRAYAGGAANTTNPRGVTVSMAVN